MQQLQVSTALAALGTATKIMTNLHTKTTVSTALAALGTATLWIFL